MPTIAAFVEFLLCKKSYVLHMSFMILTIIFQVRYSSFLITKNEIQRKKDVC